MTFLRLVWTVAALAALGACGDDSNATEPLQISTRSNRADLVSGGNALVEVRLPAGSKGDTLKVELNGRDVTSAFTSATTDTRAGLIGGLDNGRNVLVARADGATTAELVVTRPTLASSPTPQVRPHRRTWPAPPPTAG